MSGREAFAMKVDLSGFMAQMDADVVAIEAAARPAAQAAAQVLYDEVKRNVARLKRHTGNLDRSIYQAFSKENSGPGLATYHVSWNYRTAPHAGLVEYGHLQRYVTYQGSDGQIRLQVRPGMEGTSKPGRRASQAQKDAYYVPLPGGPRQVAARPFIRPAVARFEAAMGAAKAEFLAQLVRAGVTS